MLSKTFLLSALAATAAAQTYNTTFATGLLQYLQNNGFTSLAQAINSSIESPGTINLLNNVNATGKTLLAPTNTAFNGLAANATTNSTLLGDRLAYHLLSGSFPGSSFATSPQHTVARTYLNDPSLVTLEGNKTQAIAFNIDGGATRVLNQNTVVTITNTTSYQNLLIQVVDAVIDTPGTFSAAFATYKLTALPTVLDQLNFTDALEAARGITVFAPNDQALTNAASALQGANQTQIATVVANHVINGTTVYSPSLGQGSLTSAAGQGYSFTTNSSGTFVTSGSATARVVQADVIVKNGVVHIIDAVLFNNQSNPSAAASAYSAYTSTAGQNNQQQTGAVGATPTETGPIGGTNTHNAALAIRLVDQSTVLSAVVVVAAAMSGAALLI
ncbi:hypothetical protein FRC04_008604 [Tulasnella sp. 424]|nr:hypothetical protein FRC04_008604 [Tulasnella sp. 424]KAG8965680.1 hypothetical protein FRC05_003068 [Tulasnella sp. 425]